MPEPALPEPAVPEPARLGLGWPQVLAWRLGRHLLDPFGELPVPGVVERLCGVQAQVASSAELAIRVRRRASRPGEVAAALRDGALIRTWAMRGSLHLLTPEQGPALLALMAAGRSWERPSWQRAFGAGPEVIERLREAVDRALDGKTLTREALIEAVVAEPGLEGLGDGLRSGWGTLLKPLAWQGTLCSGPAQGTRVTFARPKDVSPGWGGLPDVETAAPLAIAAYLGAHGPATSEAFSGWMSGGFFGKRMLKGWFELLGERLASVDVEGRAAFVRREDLDEIAAARPMNEVRLLPGFDQWVLGPGTADERVVPAARRPDVSRQSGWIAPVVIAGGVVSGTWELEGDEVRVAWFSEAGRVPRTAIGAEVERLGTILDRRLRLRVSTSRPGRSGGARAQPPAESAAGPRGATRRRPGATRS